MASNQTAEQLRKRAKADFDRDVELAKRRYDARLEVIEWMSVEIGGSDEDVPTPRPSVAAEMKSILPQKQANLYREVPRRGGISNAVREFARAAREDFTVQDIVSQLRARGLYYSEAELAIVAALKRLETQEEIKKIRRGTNSMPALYRRIVNQGAN